MTWHPPSLHRVPWGRFPDFDGTMQMLRLPRRHPGALRLHLRPGTYLARCLLPRLAGSGCRGPGISTSGIPGRIGVERRGPPRFLGNPHADMPCSLTPVGRSRLAMAACRCCLPQFRLRRLPRYTLLSGLDHTACQLPVYASSRTLPHATQHSVPAAGQALPGGIGYPLGSIRRF